jgi:hypothetical protein
MRSPVRVASWHAIAAAAIGKALDGSILSSTGFLRSLLRSFFSRGE